ncbi:MAG TPA: hypothetical protein VF495_18730 [Phenylobacterium sp.]
MPNHRLIVARGFRIAGWTLGAPSVLAAIGLGAGALVLGARPAQPSQALSVGDYGLVGLLSNAASGLAGVLSLLGGVAAWAMGLLAAAALLIALFAGLLHLVGRGLGASAAWARILAIALSALMALNALLSLALVQGVARLVDAVLLAVLGYAIWALGWKFKASA